MYKASTDDDFVNKILPIRASNLAKRLAAVLKEYLRKSQHEPREEVQLDQNERRWLGKIEDLVLDALNFITRIQQRKMRTFFEWPKKDEVFKRQSMWSLNGGTQINSPGISLKIMPVGYVEVIGGRRKLKRAAVVYLNIPVSAKGG